MNHGFQKLRFYLPHNYRYQTVDSTEKKNTCPSLKLPQNIYQGIQQRNGLYVYALYFGYIVFYTLINSVAISIQKRIKNNQFLTLPIIWNSRFENFHQEALNQSANWTPEVQVKEDELETQILKPSERGKSHWIMPLKPLNYDELSHSDLFLLFKIICFVLFELYFS